MQRDHTTHFVTDNDKSDLKVIGICAIRWAIHDFLKSFVSLSCTVSEILSLISQNCKRSHNPDHAH